jgi:hypothetical protein
VATDALEVLGTIITDKQVGRDAIHLACEPVTAGEAIVPGQDISVTDGVAWTSGKWVGIADPFIEMTIPKGAKFLCVIYPRKITSLRHVWSHPDFPEDGESSSDIPETPTWKDLDRAADEFGRKLREHPLSGGEVIEAMEEGYFTVYGSDAHGSMDVPDWLWELYEKVNGRMAGADPRNGGDGAYFSCSC